MKYYNRDKYDRLKAMKEKRDTMEFIQGRKKFQNIRAEDIEGKENEQKEGEEAGELSEEGDAFENALRERQKNIKHGAAEI